MPTKQGLYTLEDEARERKIAGLQREKQEKVLLGAKLADINDLKSIQILVKQQALHNAPRTPKELHKAIQIIFGSYWPLTATAPDANAPFQWISDVYFGKAKRSFAIGARLSGKTYGAAVLHYMLNTFHPGYTSRHAAANREQAAVASNYLRSFSDDAVKAAMFNGKPGNNEVRWKNASHWKIVTGSTAGVCLNGWTSVVTNQGNLTIQEIVSKKLDVNVLSYNWETGHPEWKPVTNYFDHGPEQDYVKIVTKHKTVRALPSMTSNHEVYLSNGSKVQAGDVKVGDNVAVLDYVFTEDQRQVILGGLLGDATIGKEGRYSFAHGMSQKPYLMWKAEAFSLIDCSINEELGGFGTPCVKARVSVTLGFKELRDEWYHSGKKRIPKYVWDELTPLGLAVWLMDDGGYSGNNWNIYINSFDDDKEDILAYFVRLGFDPVIYRDRNDQPVLSFGREGSRRLTELVAPYLSIEDKQFSGWKRWLCPKINTGRWGVVGSEVVEVLPVRLGLKNRKYDITVEDNHNFFLASGQLVSNSGQHPNAAFWDEIEFWKVEAIEQTWYVPARQNGWDKAWVAMSTRQRSFGAANWLANKAEEKGVQIYKWTAFETMQRCKTCIAIDKHPHGSHEARQSACNLWEDCYGQRGTKSSGWVPLEDVQETKRSLSPAAWRVQGVCDKPSSSGLVLMNFEHQYRMEGGNYTHFVYQPNLPLYGALDPAEGKKSCFFFIQVHEGNIYIFDEIIIDACPNTSTMKKALYDHCRKKAYADPVLIIVDPRKTDSIADLRTGSLSGEGIGHKYKAAPSPTDDARGGQEVARTIEYLRKEIQDGEGNRRLFVNPKQCPGLCHAIREFHYPTDMNNVVLSDKPADDYKDEIDPLRYFCQWKANVYDKGGYSVHWISG